MKRAHLLIALTATILAMALLCFHMVSRYGRRSLGEVSATRFPSTSTIRAGSDSYSAQTGKTAFSASVGLPGAPMSAALAGANLIEEICGPDAYLRLEELSAAGSLSRGDCRTLAEFVFQPTTDEKLERMASIKNTVMNILARQEHLPEQWESMLQQLIADEEQHIVIRVYALQHLFAWYEEARGFDRATGNVDPGFGKVVELFWRLTDHPQGSVAATALIGLSHLVGHDPMLDVSQLMAKTGAILEAQQADPLLEISAFQVAALLNQTNVLFRAIEVAQTGSTIASRVSAVAAVGAVGTRSEVATLESLLEEPNASVRTAAQAAITRLKSKYGG